MQSDLRKVARNHSKDMARLDYFEHENFAGQTHADRYKEAQISDVISGENLAKIGGYNHPTHRAQKGLMNSPGHRANILNEKFNCVGIGIHKSQFGVYYYTQNFARRKLMFTKNPPESVSLRRGLTLHFKPVGPVSLGVYRILDATGVIKEKGFSVQSKNRVHLTFPSTGTFQVQVYANHKNGLELEIANDFTIRVKRGLFS